MCVFVCIMWVFRRFRVCFSIQMHAMLLQDKQIFYLWVMIPYVTLRYLRTANPSPERLTPLRLPGFCFED